MRGKNDSQTEVKIPEWIETAYKDYITKSTARGSSLQDALWAKMMPGNTTGGATGRTRQNTDATFGRNGGDVWDELIAAQNQGSPVSDPRNR